MVSADVNAMVRNAENIYEERLRSLLEPSHRDEFVAIEPVSGDYYLGRTLSDAMGAAHDAHPDRLSHAMRVGHDATLHFGVHLR
jgi:hypothetical protein